FIQRNKTFARLLVEDLIPPINFIISAFRDSRLTNWNQRFTVCWVFLGVRSISALEKIRLKLGGIPNRG
ncbi:MAG: glycosyltransferase family 2 protein, partial [Coleofasciculus sp. C2-GNP5-27]